jgi:hypothetical protein
MDGAVDHRADIVLIEPQAVGLAVEIGSLPMLAGSR